MYCPNCASQIHSDVRFCTSCGMDLNAISDLLSGKIIRPPQSSEIFGLLEKCHNGYMSTVIGLGLVITSLLIVIAATTFGVVPAAIGALVFLAWAIPAIAQGVGKWLSARREITSILNDVPGAMRREPEKSLASEVANTGSLEFAASVTERTTASLDQRA